MLRTLQLNRKREGRMKLNHFLLLLSIVFTLCAFNTATAQDSFTPPTADGQCYDTFDPDSVDETTWNEYAPVTCSPSTARLFSDAGPNDIFEFELQADFDIINDPNISVANKDQATSPGTLRYQDPVTNQTITIPITLEARGNSRFSHCAFRPLKIVFDTPQTGNIFEGVSRKLKVVTHCGDHPTSPWILGGTPEEQRQRLLAEYYFYQVFETLGSTALSTRLARITYRDDDGSVIVSEYAFLREREDDACQRCGFVDEADDAEALTPDATSVFQKHLYNKFVYNNDYSVFNDDGNHNTRRCKDASLSGFYIPYDWDLTGVIRPEYSKNGGINYEDNMASFWDWLDTQAPEVRTKIQAWHLVDHDGDMWQVLQNTWMEEEGEELMQGWYSLYMCALRCYLGMGGSINIIEPTESSPAMIQPTNGSGRLLIRIDYQPLSLIPNMDDFEVLIGGESAPVISGALVGSQYWLVVQTPAGITTESTLQVSCRLCAIVVEDSEDNAVPFGSPSDSDTVLVIDTSGSMNDDRKIESAINAAVLFVNTMRDNERIGVIEYSGELPSGYGRSEEVYSIDFAMGNRSAAAIKIRDLSTGDNTPLGTGLVRGLEELDSFPEDDQNNLRSLILLSDGKENVPNFWADPPSWYYSPPYPANTPVIDTFVAPVNNAVQIHTISLGPDANPDLMEDISEDRGTYRHADVIGVSGSANIKFRDVPFLSSVAYASDSDDIFNMELPLRLSNLYEHLHNETSNQQRILQTVHVTGSIRRDHASTGTSELSDIGNCADFILIHIEAGLSYATITANWTKPASKNLQIVPPLGQDLNHIAITNSNTNTVFRINQPIAGEWRICIPEQTRGEKILITLSGISSERGAVRAIIPKDQPLAGSMPAEGPRTLAPGEPITILLALMGAQPVLNATVTANIHSIANGVEHIQLQDNGTGNDDKADDGFYTGTATHTDQGGAFNIEINATWTGADSMQRSRVFPLSVSMLELDSDGDSISDQDEARIGLDPNNPQDGGADSDRDGLPNWKELLIGLDPFEPDSDGGGTLDGAEVASGGNPENPNDDADLSKDSDGDRLPDMWETAFGLDPNNPDDANKDGDGDGLSNDSEFEQGTSPNNPDTDGDQVLDGEEVEERTDPTDPLNRIQPSEQPDDDKGDAYSQFYKYLYIVILLLIIIILLLIYIRK